jgi:hypothetical protein
MQFGAAPAATPKIPAKNKVILKASWRPMISDPTP